MSATSTAERAGRTPQGAASPSAWSRLLWSLLPLAVIVIGAQIPLPGTDTAVLFDGTDTPRMHVYALGLTPIMTAYLLVEVIALLVPPLRPKRHTLRGRTQLSLATLIVTLLLSSVQAYGLLSFLLVEGSASSLWLPLATLMAAMALLWAALGAADRRGLGSAFALLFSLVTAYAFVLGEAQAEKMGGQGPGLGTKTLLVALAGIATLLALRRPAREDNTAERASISIRIPSSGILPLVAVSAVLAPAALYAARVPGLAKALELPWWVFSLLIALVAPFLIFDPKKVALAWVKLFVVQPPEPKAASIEGAEPALAISLGGSSPEAAQEASDTGAEGPGAGHPPSKEKGARHADPFSAYAPPGDTLEDATEKGPRAGARLDAESVPAGALSGWRGRASKVLAQTFVPSFAYLAVVAWPVWPVAGKSGDAGKNLAASAGICLVVAALADILGELRFRLKHPDAVAVLHEHRLEVADAAAAALAAGGMEAYIKSAGCRALLLTFGPFAPVEVLVPADAAERARHRLFLILDPETQGQLTARAAEPEPSEKTKAPRKKKKKKKPAAAD